jgi:hypothetical protein
MTINEIKRLAKQEKKTKIEAHNKIVAREGSWLCNLLQEGDLHGKERKDIINQLTESFKLKLKEVTHGQSDQKGKEGHGQGHDEARENGQKE